MGKGIERLSALTISRRLRRGYYADGGGLYLQVTATGAKSWVFRFRIRSGQPDAGRLREMGLGSFNAVTLAEARDAARVCRKQLQAGADPIVERNSAVVQTAAVSAASMTFRDCAKAYIKAHKPSWHNEKHAQQWTNTLATYVEPLVGDLPVRDIDTRLVMKVLEPIWTDKRETASRVRGRMEVILDWAAVQGYRESDNPARWKGKIDKLLPSRSRTNKVQHHAALHYRELPSFMALLRDQKGIAAAALEFTILTATRTGEVLGATWPEINFETRTWIIPANRMKAGREHRVPLTQPALTVLKRMEKMKGGPAIFPSPGLNGTSLSNMAMLNVLKRMKRADLTVHGFRSTFRDWVSEQTDTQREVAEAALAHAVGNAVEAAYRRGDLFEKRRVLMGLWAAYCQRSADGEVLQFQAKA